MSDEAYLQDSNARLSERDNSHVPFLLESVLYRYRSISSKELLDRECEAIRSGYLYWNSPTDFNDPFDCLPALIFEGSEEDRRKRLKKSYEVAPSQGNRAARRAEMNRALKISRQSVVSAFASSKHQDLIRFGMCCFTTERDNILMWSHYAGNHTGVCLGFKPSAEAMDFLSAMPVQYSNIRPTYNLMHSLIEQNVFQSLVTKSDRWSYEQEWRVIDPKIQNRRRRYPARSLTQVIFGCRISDEDREKVRAAVSDSESTPQFFQCRMDDRHYELVLDPAN